MTKVDVRLRAYLPFGADQGPLPVAESVNASFVLNDVGALTFGYSPKAPRASLLGQPLEIAAEVSTDSGLTWAEPPNARFVYLVDGLDPLDPSNRFSVQCKSYVWRLSKADILPNGLLNAEGKRAFLSANVGTVLKTLLNEATARGALSGLTHSSFSTTTDSAGAAWSKTLTIYYEPGLDYLTILTNLAEQGFCDFRTNGRALQVYNPDAALAVDRTVGATQVTLRAGRDLTEAPFTRTWEGLANYAFFAGADGKTYEYTNPSAETPWGRQEIFISNGSVTDEGTMAALTQAQLGLGNSARVEYTRGLDFTRAVNLPFTGYGVGDYVWSAVSGAAAEKLRIRQITLAVNDQGITTGNVVLNDRFLEADVRAQRRIAGITNGASSGTGTGGPPVTTDKKPPAQVTGLSVTSDAFVTFAGATAAAVTVTWGEVTTNSDGTAAEDIDHYEVFARKFGTAVGSETLAGNAYGTSWQASPYRSGEQWWFRVRAVDQTGNKGAKSAEVGHTMASDALAPQAPSTPTMVAKLGQVYMTWDGQPVSGTWPGDVARVEFHVSTTSGFTPSSSTLIDRRPIGRGTAVITTGTFGTALYGRLVAVDDSGNASVPSGQATATPARLVGSDLGQDSITYAQLAFKDVGNLIPDGSFEGQAFRDTVLSLSHAAWSFTQSNPYHLAWSAILTNTVNPSTFRELMLINDRVPIREGEQLFVRVCRRGSVGANGGCDVIIIWYGNAGGAISQSVVAGHPPNDGIWGEAAGKYPAPVGAASFRVVVRGRDTGTTGTWQVDAVEVRKTVGTAIIDDAAITSALIANLAVNDAKIANLDVGKLSAGTLSANVLVAGLIRTATAGARVEMGPGGIRLYNAANLATVEITPGKEYLRVNATTDVSLISTNHPFQIGPDNAQNMAFDNNEIQSRNGGGGAADLALNLNGGDVSLSMGAWRTIRNAPTDCRFISNSADLGFQAAGGVPEMRVVNGGASAYRPIRASAFPVGSAAATKRDRSDFDPFDIIIGAPSERWRYRSDLDDDRWHYGPMADDLPDLRHGEGADATLDVAALVGVLWEAVRRLLNERGASGAES